MNARPSAIGHLIEAVARLTRHARRGKQFFVKSFDLLLQSTTIVVLAYMFVLDKRTTLWLRDTVRQTSLGKSAARLPLTSLGMSAWPYRVTTKKSYCIHKIVHPAHRIPHSAKQFYNVVFRPSVKGYDIKHKLQTCQHNVNNGTSVQGSYTRKTWWEHTTQG